MVRISISAGVACEWDLDGRVRDRNDPAQWCLWDRLRPYWNYSHTIRSDISGCGVRRIFSIDRTRVAAQSRPAGSPG